MKNTKLTNINGKAVKRAYYHFIKVTSQPADRGLPSELVRELDSLGYSPASPNLFKS